MAKKLSWSQVYDNNNIILVLKISYSRIYSQTCCNLATKCCSSYKHVVSALLLFLSAESHSDVQTAVDVDAKWNEMKKIMDAKVDR